MTTIPDEGLENIKAGIVHGLMKKFRKHGAANIKLERNSRGLKYTVWIDDNKEKIK